MVHRQPTGLPHMGSHPTQPRSSYTPRRTGRHPPPLGKSHEAIPRRGNNASANAEATPTLTPPKRNTHPLPPASSSLTPHSPHTTLMSSTSEQAGQTCAATQTHWSRQYIYCWPDEIKMPRAAPSPKPRSKKDTAVQPQWTMLGVPWPIRPRSPAQHPRTQGTQTRGPRPTSSHGTAHHGQTQTQW